MRHKLRKFCVTVRNLANDEEGQDLIEYALVSALIAVSAIGGMKHLATAVSSLFSSIASTL